MVADNKEATEPRVPVGYVSRSPPWLGWPLWNICVTDDHGYVPLVVNTFRSFPHAWLITDLLTRLTRRVAVVEQELLTIPEDMSSSPGFWRCSCKFIFSFMCMFCRSLFFILYFFFSLLCCMSFFDLRVLIAPLVSSNSSYTW